MNECVINAYAKINLHLDISAKRDDGYHDVETVMQAVSLCDTVSVKLTDADVISCECNVEGVPTDEKNIAVRAAKLFCERTELKSGVYVKIDKRIPMAAGLAGGSTDAAATLVALNRINGNPLSEQELCEIGSKLGADVPFCIACGCVYSDGRGDVLHDFPQIPQEAVFVVACGGEGVSTPWAYGLLDRVYDDFRGYTPRGTDSLRESLRGALDFEKHIFNIFEAPVFSKRPVAAEIKQYLLDNGAENAMMSGSGPSVFGIFDSLKNAEKASKAIVEKGYFATVCTPIGKRKI